MQPCSIVGCEAIRHHALGFCKNHYFKHYRSQPRYLTYMKTPHALKVSRARERRRYYKEKSNPKRTIKKAAYAAVHQLINRGELTSLPCEKCGKAAQAHHDSYLPEDWLKVRWLCPKDHSAWHSQNEPIYPEDMSPWAT